MNSIDQSFSPTINLLCPQIRFLDTPKSFIENSDDSLIKSHNLVPFKRSKTKKDEEKNLFCGACEHETIIANDYWCEQCCLTYHKECVESPYDIKVPYHPKHFLQLHFPSGELIFFQNRKKCHHCAVYTSFYYSCSICDFNLHPICAIKSNTLHIKNLKRHEHTLTYFPRKNSLTCDVCGLSDDKCFIYVCNECDFIVHKICIDLPSTIGISRHNHRISFNLGRHKDRPCGVCRQSVDKNYGGYSCVKGCEYVAHSKCATRRDLWDGKELEGEPEIEFNDIKPFEDIGNGIIEHFSHPNHHIRLKKNNDNIDEEKRCHACISPVNDSNIYNCMKCDFIIHETCANLSRTKSHQLHAHLLTLQVDHKGGKFQCIACRRKCCGFAYKCSKAHCSYILDVRCAMVSEPFIHEFHPHPLFLASPIGNFICCSICRGYDDHLSCIECSFVICFPCATLPYKVKYAHDEHYLTFSDKRVEIGYNWCEICEKEIYPNGFYACNVCSVTLHIKCILGADPFMKHGQSIVINKLTFLIIPNDCLTRKYCLSCDKLLPYRIAFQILNGGQLFCSLECIYSFGEDSLLSLENMG